jgi:hypothetical protein
MFNMSIFPIIFFTIFILYMYYTFLTIVYYDYFVKTKKNDIDKVDDYVKINYDTFNP